jgi:hypothetical protein
MGFPFTKPERNSLPCYLSVVSIWAINLHCVHLEFSSVKELNKDFNLLDIELSNAIFVTR